MQHLQVTKPWEQRCVVEVGREDVQRGCLLECQKRQEVDGFHVHHQDARSEAPKGFGRRLQQLREAAGLSQPKLGAACRMQRTYVSKVETGHCLPYMDALLRFRAGLRLEIAGFAWLLGGDDEFVDPTLRRRVRPADRDRPRDVGGVEVVALDTGVQ